MKDGCVRLRETIRQAMSTIIPNIARIWETRTLGTTEEKASTNSYAKINQPTDLLQERTTGHVSLQA